MTSNLSPFPWMDPNSCLIYHAIMQSPSMGTQYTARQNIPYHEAIGVIIYTMLGT